MFCFNQWVENPSDQVTRHITNPHDQSIKLKPLKTLVLGQTYSHQSTGPGNQSTDRLYAKSLLSISRLLPGSSRLPTLSVEPSIDCCQAAVDCSNSLLG